MKLRLFFYLHHIVLDDLFNQVIQPFIFSSTLKGFAPNPFTVAGINWNTPIAQTGDLAFWLKWDSVSARAKVNSGSHLVYLSDLCFFFTTAVLSLLSS